MDREQRIREIAYSLWEEEGRPEGAADRHWFSAEARFAAGQGEREEGGEAPIEAAATSPDGPPKTA